MSSTADSGASLADRESSLDLIKLDISRTFPSLFIFQKVRSVNIHLAEIRLELINKICIFYYLFFILLLSFCQGGPYHDLLHSVLGAYTCYRPDVGYVSVIYLFYFILSNRICIRIRIIFS